MTLRSIFFLTFLILLCLSFVIPVQANEFQFIEEIRDVTITEEDRLFSYAYGTYSYANIDFWEGRISSNDSWIVVNITVIEIICPNSLQLGLDYGIVHYQESGGSVTYYYDTELVNSSLSSWDHPLVVGDFFQYAWNDTLSKVDNHVLNIGVETINGVDFTGSVSFEVSISLSGMEEKANSKSAVGFLVLMILIVLVYKVKFSQ